MSARTPRLGDALVINLGTTLLFHSRALAPTTRRLSRRVSRFARQFRPRPASSMRAGETSRAPAASARPTLSRALRIASIACVAIACVARGTDARAHRASSISTPSSSSASASVVDARLRADFDLEDTARGSTSSRTKVPRTTDAVRSRRPARVRATGRCSRVARAAGAVRTPSPEARTGAISRAARTREEASRRTGRFRECGTPDRRTMGVVRTRMGKI